MHISPVVMQSLALLGLLTSAMGGQRPYQDFSEQGVRFYGPGRELEPPDTLTAVRLGVTGPAQGIPGAQLRQGVELALAEANAAGGHKGLPYRIVFRPDDESWSIVARQVVRLVHKDEVWGVIGSLDGERAHAAELVVAKLWAPVITPGAADLTIDFANVPWVFRLMPQDRCQADLLLRAAHERDLHRVVLATEGSRDARLASERVNEAAHALGHPLHIHLEFNAYDARTAVPRLVAAGGDALLLWARPETAIQLITSLRERGVDLPVFVSGSLVRPELAQAPQDLGQVFGAAPFDLESHDPVLVRFRQKFRQLTGELPGYTAAYGYDAAKLFTNAIAEVGLNRVRICDWLLGVRQHGVTGEIRFNSLGGNLQEPVLVELRDGRWRRP